MYYLSWKGSFQKDDLKTDTGTAIMNKRKYLSATEIKKNNNIELFTKTFEEIWVWILKKYFLA